MFFSHFLQEDQVARVGGIWAMPESKHFLFFLGNRPLDCTAFWLMSQVTLCKGAPLVDSIAVPLFTNQKQEPEEL